MTRNQEKLFNALMKIGAPVIVRPEGDGDGAFVMSAEENYNRVWADYWEGCEIDADVIKLAKEHGFFCEWINPGCVGFYPA